MLARAGISNKRLFDKLRGIRGHTEDFQAIRAASNCLRTFLASSEFCLVRQISACADAAAKKLW
jgi:hypothetical protein